MSGIKGPDGRIYTITIRALDAGTDDLDLAASTADADAFIEERYSFNFDGTQSRDDADIDIGVGELQQLTTDDGGCHADGNWIWNVQISPASPNGEANASLLGTSDALVASDFFLV